MYPKYEEDFYGWAMANAQLLKERKMSEVDVENLIEEIESMGRSEKHQLENRLAVLIAHLLKWHLESSAARERNRRGWQGTIEEQRKRSHKLIKDNPGLKNRLDEVLSDAYELALPILKKETSLDLKIIPTECPYTLEQCLDDTFYPE
jgi:hypothetical protein